jgi:predicted transcriptional regulator
MSKSKRYEVKYKILLAIREAPLSYTRIQSKLSTNYNSVKDNCEEMEIYGFIKVKKIKDHPENGKPASFVEITPSGLETLKKFERNFEFK